MTTPIGPQDERPPVGQVQFGSLRRLRPISDCFGGDRGRPVDRYYIENFLAREAACIQGRVLEVGDRFYTERFGGDRVQVSDVLNVTEGNPYATIVADLTRADHVPSDTFDCIILTQTLQYVYDPRPAVRTLHRILKPGGVVLATLPGISQKDQGDWTWYWSFTGRGVRRLFEEAFAPEAITVESHGNVLAATAFLQGIAAEELTPAELDTHDPLYEVSITLKARRE